MNVVHVSYSRGNELMPMGRLAYHDRKILFEYRNEFLDSGLEMSPFKLPLKPGVMVCNDFVFDGLFGIFNDSLPDGWGRLLLDRKLIKMGVNPHSLTPLDRLRYVGSKGMGALQYQPELDGTRALHPFEDLDKIARECFEVLAHDEDTFVEDLLALNGSSAGARPKILVRLLKKGFSQTINDPRGTHDDWLIKFRSSTDPKDIGTIEYAYHLMAKKAGLDVPEARLFKSKNSAGYFGVKRFDHVENQFMHMHTVSGLLHADHRLPCLDYVTLMKVTWILTKDVRECEKQFRLAVFNVLAHNRDDHAKNFSFLMDERGVWKVSPAYDLTFSAGPNGEHYTTVMQEGKNPGIPQLMKLADSAALSSERARQVITEVREAISNWTLIAKEAQVSLDSLQMINKTIS